MTTVTGARRRDRVGSPVTMTAHAVIPGPGIEEACGREHSDRHRRRLPGHPQGAQAQHQEGQGDPGGRTGRGQAAPPSAVHPAVMEQQDRGQGRRHGGEVQPRERDDRRPEQEGHPRGQEHCGHDGDHHGMAQEDAEGRRAPRPGAAHQQGPEQRAQSHQRRRAQHEPEDGVVEDEEPAQVVEDAEGPGGGRLAGQAHPRGDAEGGEGRHLRQGQADGQHHQEPPLPEPGERAAWGHGARPSAGPGKATRSRLPPNCGRAPPGRGRFLPGLPGRLAGEVPLPGFTAFAAERYRRLATLWVLVPALVAMAAFVVLFQVTGRMVTDGGTTGVELQRAFTAERFGDAVAAWGDGVETFKTSLIMLDFAFPLVYAAGLGSLVALAGGPGPSRATGGSSPSPGRRPASTGSRTCSTCGCWPTSTPPPTPPPPLTRRRSCWRPRWRRCSSSPSS